MQHISSAPSKQPENPYGESHAPYPPPEDVSGSNVVAAVLECEEVVVAAVVVLAVLDGNAVVVAAVMVIAVLEELVVAAMVVAATLDEKAVVVAAVVVIAVVEEAVVTVVAAGSVGTSSTLPSVHRSASPLMTAVEP